MPARGALPPRRGHGHGLDQGRRCRARRDGRRHRRPAAHDVAAPAAVGGDGRRGRLVGRRGRVIAELVAGVDPDVIAGVCVSGIGPCLLVRRRRRSRRCGRRSSTASTRAPSARSRSSTAALGAEAILDALRQGAVHRRRVGPKLLWLRRHEPEVWARRARLVHGELLRRRAADRRVRPRPPLGQPVRPALRPRRAATGPTTGRRDRPRPASCPRLAWPAEVVGTVTAAGGRGETGLPAGTPVVRGHRRRLGRGVQRRRAQARATSC